MVESAKPPNTRAIVGAICFGSLPFGLWFVLNYLRPDLVQAMLDHHFGYVITQVEVFLTMLSLATYLVSVTAVRHRRGLRIGMTIAAALLFTLPALFLVLFGPIIFASMYGNIQPQ